jgi:hypothetical protein
MASRTCDRVTVSEWHAAPDGGGHIVHTDHASVIDINPCGFETFLFQESAHVQYRWVLHGAGDKIAAFFLQGQGQAFDGVIVGLGAA